jgi:hypothetical protein
MKKLAFFLMVFGFTMSINVYAQEQTQDEMMKAWQESMTPGPMHQMLAKSVGDWKAEITTYEDPSNPMKSEGTSSYEMILDGRYLQGNHNANFGDMEMNGRELSGYDNIRKKFFSTWIDNFGTGIMYQEGTFDEATKSITFTGTTTDPFGKEMGVRQIVKFIDDDNSFMEMYMIQDGKESKWMEMKSTRVK